MRASWEKNGIVKYLDILNIIYNNSLNKTRLYTVPTAECWYSLLTAVAL